MKRRKKVAKTTQAQKYVFSIINNAFQQFLTVSNKNKQFFTSQVGVMPSETESTARAVNSALETNASTLFKPFVETFKQLKMRKLSAKKKALFADVWNVFYTTKDSGAISIDRETNFRLQVLEQLKREGVNVYNPHELYDALHGYSIDELLKLHEENPDVGDWMLSDQDVDNIHHPLQDFLDELTDEDFISKRQEKMRKAEEVINNIDATAFRF